MTHVFRTLVVAALGLASLLVPAPPAAASGPGGLVSGALFEEILGVPTPVPIQSNGGEFYAVKTLGRTPDDVTDWMYDLGDGRGQTPSFDASSGESYGGLPPLFTHDIEGEDVVNVIVTFPDGRIAIDGAALRWTLGSMGVVHPQVVGNSPRVGMLDGTGLSLGPLGYSVPGIANRGAGPGTFPHGTRSGIAFAFAPLIDVNNVDVWAGNGWAWGAEVPWLGSPDRHGIIRGYNVYRLASDVEPTRAQLGAAANFQYFIDVDSFDLFTPDSGGVGGMDQNGDGLPDGDGADSPQDAAADSDLAGLVNPRVHPQYGTTGDEVVIFQDAERAPNGTQRAVGTAPLPGVSYWYAVQPVVHGSVEAFAWTSIARWPHADLRVDSDLDGVADSVNLDVNVDPTALVLEFSSPQANHGLPGLGLTNGGIPLLSQPVRGIINPAAATGRVSLDAARQAGRVHLHWSAAFETADVLGYEVVCVEGNERRTVTPVLITARGGEGNVYEFINTPSAFVRRRTDPAGAGGVLYAVEVHHSDGTPPALVGPVEPRPDPADVTRQGRRAATSGGAPESRTTRPATRR